MSNTAESIDLNLVVQIVSAYVIRNPVPMAGLPALISSVTAKMSEIAGLPTLAAAEAGARPVPAVPISRSITPDYLICLENGKRFKSLKRTLAVRYGMTPDEYRSKWGLPRDYPMVAPKYSKLRSAVAREIGLGKLGAAKRRGDRPT